MASGVCPPSPRKEDGRTADRNEHRELPACTRRNPPMDLPEKENKTGGYPHDDFCPCRCGGTFAGAHVVGHQPVYGAAWQRKGKEHTAAAVVERFNEMAYGIQEAQIFAMVPPAIPGLGASGGLQLQLEDRNNLGPTEMQRAVETLMATYHTQPALASISSMYQANVPQYFLNIDRDKVQFMVYTCT